MSERRGGRVGNAADKEQVRNAKRAERNDQMDRGLRLKWLMSSEIGRRFMWDDVLARFGTFESVLNASNNLTFVNIGRQDLGHEWMADLMRVCPNEYVVMYTEAMRRRMIDMPDESSTSSETDG